MEIFDPDEREKLGLPPIDYLGLYEGEEDPVIRRPGVVVTRRLGIDSTDPRKSGLRRRILGVEEAMYN